MAEHSNIPIPADSGSSGLQTTPEEPQRLDPAPPFSGHHIASAIDGIAASNTRALGGEVASALVAAATRQLVSDNDQLRAENRELKSRFDAQRDLLETSRTRSAVLAERLRAEGRNKHLRNLGIAVGVGLIGTGINLARSSIDAYSVGTILVGSLLALLGWFAGPKDAYQ